MDDFLRQVVPGRPWKEVYKLFQERFNVNFSNSTIDNRCTKLKITNGLIGGRFEKGHSPHNKFKKGTHYSPQTEFKKGMIPFNTAKIGTQVARDDGYIWCKIDHPNIWKQRHRLLWEKVYGPIIKKHFLVFINGKSDDIRISNLKMISQRQHALLNKQKFENKNAENFESRLALVDVQLKISDLKKGKKSNV